MTARSNSRSIAEAVEQWFGSNARELPWRDEYDPYYVWISEVMAQQTRMDVVLGYHSRFVERFPTLQDLASASEDEVVTAWSGLGYYRRARMLHRSAIEIVERFDGIIPSDATSLASLSGFGRYTAGAVSSIAFEKRAAIADGNVTRLAARLGRIDHPWRSSGLEKAAWTLAESLVKTCKSPRALNQGLMELGARVCRPKNPDCQACPLEKFCKSSRDGVTEDYPLPAKKKTPTPITIPLWIFTDSKDRVLFRKASGTLMNGMLQLPQGNDQLYPDPIVIDTPGELLGTVQHSITSRKVRFEVYAPPLPREIRDTPGEWLWIAPDKLDEYGVPSWVAKVLALWKELQ